MTTFMPTLFSPAVRQTAVAPIARRLRVFAAGSAVAGLASLLVPAQPAAAYSGVEQPFFGLWRNADPRTHGVTRIDIRPERGSFVFVRAWRRCPAGECEFGRATGRIFFGRNEFSRDTDQAAIHVRFGRDDTSGSVLIRLNPRGEVVVHALLSNPNAGDTYATERFERAGHGHAYGALWRAPRF